MARAVDDFACAVGAATRASEELRRILYVDELADTLLRRFRGSPPDVVYERAASFGTAGATIATVLGVPLLLEVNAPLALEERMYRGQELAALAAAAERRTLGRADAVIVVSAALRDYVSAAGVPAERIHVLPNGVDGALFRPAPRAPSVRARWDLDGEPVIGFVGGYQPWHGIDALPALVERLLPRHPNLRLLVVGDGRGRAEFEREVAARGIGAHVRVTGALPHDARHSNGRTVNIPSGVVSSGPIPSVRHRWSMIWSAPRR
jgi:glycosyltransferase involved in cell wall biosynthesis